MQLRAALVLLVLVVVVPAAADAWSTGDVVPIFVSFRRNRQEQTHRKALAETLVPRFAVHRVVHIPNFHQRVLAFGDLHPHVAKDTFAADKAADAEVEAVAGLKAEHIYGESYAKDTVGGDATGIGAFAGGSKSVDATTLALKLHFGSIGAQTPWLPLSRPPAPSAVEKEAQGEKADTRLKFLTYLIVHFHFRRGVFHEVTGVTFERRYGYDARHLVVEYVWDEDRKVDPAGAIITVHAVCLGAAFLVAMKITSAVSHSTLGKLLVVRDRAD